MTRNKHLPAEQEKTAKNATAPVDRRLGTAISRVSWNGTNRTRHADRMHADTHATHHIARPCQIPQFEPAPVPSGHFPRDSVQALVNILIKCPFSRHVPTCVLGPSRLSPPPILKISFNAADTALSPAIPAGRPPQTGGLPGSGEELWIKEDVCGARDLCGTCVCPESGGRPAVQARRGPFTPPRPKRFVDPKPSTIGPTRGDMHFYGPVQAVPPRSGISHQVAGREGEGISPPFAQLARESKTTG